MTLPRTAAEVLSGHVGLEVRSVDRMLLLLRQPRLQYGQGIHGFFCYHRGWRFVSSELMRRMTEAFTAELHHYLASRDLDLIHFKKDQRKDDVAKEYLAEHDGTERILFVGRAQERTMVWRTRRRRDATTGRSYPWLVKGVGDGQPLVRLRVRPRLRPVLHQVLRILPVQRPDLPQRP